MLCCRSVHDHASDCEKSRSICARISAGPFREFIDTGSIQERVGVVGEKRHRRRRGVLCAVGIQEAISRYDVEHPDQALRVRIGLHAGEPVREGNDFHGKSVIVASRVGGAASGGEILVSALMRELTESAGDIRFDTGREVALKGLPGTHRVYAVCVE
jgi:class 3 adenylate cyclase